MPPTDLTRGVTRLAIVGAGRLGTALTGALREQARTALHDEHRFEVVGPLGRDADAGGCEVALLCVPDREIAAAAAAIGPGVIVGHCSGATGLESLAPHEAFSLHPLMTVSQDGADFTGATAAIDGSSERALRLAQQLAHALAMTAVRVEPGDRVAYHAAASIASNFLITLEGAAERLAATAGVGREALVPLVRATVENWAALGPERALTGPVARGDEATVERQREAVTARVPELVALFDALTAATRDLAAVPQR
jgi:predicted short-subunit dehydrogenase-like oxidoreductase (DUF2520 family)